MILCHFAWIWKLSPYVSQYVEALARFHIITAVCCSPMNTSNNIYLNTVVAKTKAMSTTFHILFLNYLIVLKVDFETTFRVLILSFK